MATERSDLREGELIGGIEIEARIGSGGFGVVYRGRDPRGLRVAIKVLTPEGQDDPEVGVRLMKEAMLMAEIEADNVVRFHAAGREEGRIWLAMEYVPGGTLRDKLPKGRPIEVEQALRWGRQIAEGTAELHKLRDALGHPIVHRDLKPENVLLTRDGIAKVADFGIAKFRTSLKSTTSNSAIGTPLYMAPEQMGGGADIDTRADVFALGVILYEMLCGLLPGEVGHEGELTLMEKLTRSLTQPLTPLPELNPDVPAYVWALVERALQKSPHHRPQMGEMAKELVSTLKRLRKERGRRPSFQDGAFPEPSLWGESTPEPAAPLPSSSLEHARTDPAPSFAGSGDLSRPEEGSLAAISRSSRQLRARRLLSRPVLVVTIALGIGLGLVTFRLATSGNGATAASSQDVDAGSDAPPRASAEVSPSAADAGPPVAAAAAADAGPDGGAASATPSPQKAAPPGKPAPSKTTPPPASARPCVGVMCKADF